MSDMISDMFSGNTELGMKRSLAVSATESIKYDFVILLFVTGTKLKAGSSIGWVQLQLSYARAELAK